MCVHHYSLGVSVSQRSLQHLCCECKVTHKKKAAERIRRPVGVLESFCGSFALLTIQVESFCCFGGKSAGVLESFVGVFVEVFRTRSERQALIVEPQLLV